MEASSEIATAPDRNIRTWLFNPFHYLAGGQALAVGIALILIASLIGSLDNFHFDGVLDIHLGASAPLWVFTSEGLLDWIVMGVLLLIAGKLISRSHVRTLDVFGTQALARVPMSVSALFVLLPGHRRYAAHLIAQLTKTPSDIQVGPADPIMFYIIVVVCLLMVVWTVALMYRAFAVSCNVSGGKAIGVFIAALIVGEAISKVLIIAMFRLGA